MNIKKGLALAILSGVALVGAIACQGAVPASPSTGATPTNVEPSEPPAPPTSSLPPQGGTDVEMAQVNAPIESVEINIAESFPPQYFVAIQSDLPSGCAKFNDYEVSREGTTIKIKLTNLEPAPGQQIACTAIYGYHDTSVALGSDFEGGETYTVVVNDSVTETFVAQEGGNTENEDGSKVSVPAPIDGLGINVDGTSGEAKLVVTTGLPNSCYEFESASLIHDGDIIRVDASNLRPADQNMMCAEIYRTVETSLTLETSIEPCENYSVVANGEKHSVQAIAPNVRCANPDPIGQPLPTEPDYPTAVVPAPIESVMIISTRSLPPQYVVKIISGLPSGCAQFNDYDVVLDGNEIHIKVTNLMPAPDTLVMCTQIYGYQDTSINIGSDYTRGVEYSVLVNDWPAETFVGVGGPEDVPTGIDIPLGKSVELEIDGLMLEFVEVTEDSRCPANVVCVWAGQAKVLVAANDDGEDLGEHELLLDPTGSASNSVTLGDYTVVLTALNPYPGAYAGSQDSDYVATVSVSGPSSNDETSEPTATLWSEQIPNEPGTVMLFVEITGGTNNNVDLYCAGMEWQFGDGNGMASIPNCIPWTPDSTIQRNFEQTYTYDNSGSYEVTFSYGTVEATAVIEVK